MHVVRQFFLYESSSITSWTMFSELFLNPVDCDYQLQVTSEKDGLQFRIPVHGLALRRASKFFAAMLDSDKFKESLTKAITLSVPGTRDDAVQFIRYLYQKTARDLTPESCVILMKAAHMYDVQDLLEVCERNIIKLLTPFNVCKLYSTLQQISSSNFKTSCINLMLKSAFLIFPSCLHTCLNEETMETLVKSDMLNILNEEQVLCAVWKWGVIKFGLESKDIMEFSSVSKLFSLIRWSFIEPKRIGEIAPWLSSKNEKFQDGSRKDKSRKACDNVALISFARFITVIGNEFTCAESSLSQYGQDVLIRFSCDNTILLTGLVLQLKLSTLYPGTQNYHIYVNGVQITPLSPIDLVLCSSLEGNLNYYLHRITLEFCKPFQLEKSFLNFVKIRNSSGGTIVLPSHTNTVLPSERFERDDSGVKFYFDREVKAVAEISYFLI